MAENRSNAPTKSAVPASVKKKSNHDFDDDDLLEIALPWLSQSRNTIVRSPITHGPPTTFIYQSSPQLPSEVIAITPQSAAKEDETPKQLAHPATITDDEDKDIDADFIRGKLARRAYHLPNNTYCQDYRQYIANCHLIFGLFCYDKRSPVRIKHRVLLLCGSLAFGLNITNIIYLWGNQVFHDDEITSTFREWATTKIPTNLYNSTSATNTLLEDTILEDASARFKVSMGSQLTILWTVGAAIHAAFDMALWHMISCGYCSYRPNTTSRRQEHLLFGWTTAIAIVMLMIIATCVVLYFRVFPMTEDEDGQLLLLMDDAEPAEVMGFLLRGILGCGRIPCIGGRPREVWKERNGRDGRGDFEIDVKEEV
eukprot:scaffold417_cov151-Skeletonema_menzelii.AAC.6